MWNIEGLLISLASRGFSSILIFASVILVLWFALPLIRKPESLKKKRVQKAVAIKLALIFLTITAASSLSTYRPRLGVVTQQGFPAIEGERPSPPSTSGGFAHQKLRERMQEEGHQQSDAVRKEYEERGYWGNEKD